VNKARFLYFEKLGRTFEHGMEGPTSLVGWMYGGCKTEDQHLLDWMETAKPGEYTHHNLGICIRVVED
jgi:hypothetical protein